MKTLKFLILLPFAIWGGLIASAWVLFFFAQLLNGVSSISGHVGSASTQGNPTARMLALIAALAVPVIFYKLSKRAEQIKRDKELRAVGERLYAEYVREKEQH